jgi:hypothetical protein
MSGAQGGVCGNGCEAFCMAAQAICTGTNKQFADVPTCMSDCAGYAQVKNPPYSIADVSTNDFGCRVFHLTLAAAGPTEALMHCPHIVPNSPVCTM